MIILMIIVIISDNSNNNHNNFEFELVDVLLKNSSSGLSYAVAPLEILFEVIGFLYFGRMFD